jgi:hypothetical protein
MNEGEIEEAFALFDLGTSEARAAVSFESLIQPSFSCVVSIFQMGESQS